ncbi:MAG: glycosyltransferase [Candidatus Nanopelagicales bacterium]
MSSISIVIPHYGDAVPTLALVALLLPQLAGVHEIIVADDCSTEPFPDVPGVTVLRRATNGGFGAAVNTGAAAATGDLLLILNSDLEIGPSLLADLLAAASPWQPCVAGPRIVDPDGQVDPTARHFPTVAHQVAEWLTPLARWRDQRILHEAVGHDMDAVTGDSAAATDWLVGAALMLPTALFRDAGGFDERFHMNSEEVDLQRRLRERGVPSIYLPDVSVRHEGGGSSDPAQRRAWLVDSRWRYAEKWGGTAALRAGLTAATTANLLWNLGRRALGRNTRPLATARYEFDLIRGRQR